MKKLLFITLFYFSCLHTRIIISEIQGERKIKWSQDSGLNFSDFQGKCKGKDGAGVTSSIEYKIEEKRDQVDLYLETYFYPNRSFVRVENLNNFDLLKHERLHFDITELFARKFRKFYIDSFYSKFVKNNRFEEDSFMFYFKKISYDERNIEQDRYDKETNHNLIDSSQKRWEVEVKRELQIYLVYKPVLIVMNKVKR